MRARDIKPGFYKNDQLAECSMAARLLFPGLWMLADREGRFENRPKKIKAEIFPFDDVDVASLLKELEDAGLILAYEANGSRYFWIPQFKKHQSPHKNEKNSELPAHPDDLSESESAQGLNEHPTTPEKDRSTPVIPGKIPLTPSSLTPEDIHTLTTFECVSKSELSDPEPPEAGKEKNPVVELTDEDASGGQGKVPPCPQKTIVEAYHELLLELPRVRTWRANSATALRTRWREKWKEGKFADVSGGVGYFRRFFEYVQKSDFLMGRKTGRDGRSFVCTLVWMLQARHFDDIIAGKYHDPDREAA